MINNNLIQMLSQLADHRVIRRIDEQFAKLIFAQSNDQYLAFLAALVSFELSKGNTCLVLFRQADNSQDMQLNDLTYNLNLFAMQKQELTQILATVNWQEKLTTSYLVGKKAPLFFDGERLYLQRYWFYERMLASKLVSFSVKTPLAIDKQQQLIELLDTFYPEKEPINWQKIAIATAMTNKFAVISGGPGTGKTTTVTKLLVALIMQAQSFSNFTIKLVAPTGKAAARLTESIGKAILELNIAPEIKALLPSSATTIHRLLGSINNSFEFKHNAQNLLHLDVLVIDEASMIDLPLMYKILNALPMHARLILLGDKDQLSSVEAGAVLADIFSFYDHAYSKQHLDNIYRLTGLNLPNKKNTSINVLADSVCMLHKSYRFDENSGIGCLARAVNNGSVDQLMSVLKQNYTDIKIEPITDANYQSLIRIMASSYSHYLLCLQNIEQASTDGAIEDVAKVALQKFNQYRLLCAICDGEFGVQGLNEKIEKQLLAQKLIVIENKKLNYMKSTPLHSIWYHGKPIMIAKNDHNLGLYNGDIGICIYDKKACKLKIFFELADHSIKAVLPSQVPEYETAYAMTIHKSQGSEFEHTFIILPPKFSPILTRELVYTGITRAKNQLSLYGNIDAIKQAIIFKTKRASGLAFNLSNILKQKSLI